MNYKSQNFVQSYRLSVHISCKYDFSLTDESILMKLHKAVYSLRMCMKEDNPIRSNIKGDNLRETIICLEWGGGGYILCDLTRRSSSSGKSTLEYVFSYLV